MVERDLRAVLVETSFPSDMEELAHSTGHLTPTLLTLELEGLGRTDVPVYIFHMKPLHSDRIRSEIATLGGGRIQVPEQGRIYDL